MSGETARVADDGGDVVFRPMGGDGELEARSTGGPNDGNFHFPSASRLVNTY